MAHDLDLLTSTTPDSTDIPTTLALDATTQDIPTEPARDEQAAPEPSRDEQAAPELTPDEAAALHSLDDTVIRAMPEPSVLWDERPMRMTEPAPRRPISTWVLVAVVAVVSFVAGGVTARLTAQVPLLFAQHEQPHETTASYVVPDQQEPESPAEEQPQDEPVDAPSYDTGYDTDDGWQNEDVPDESADDSWQTEDTTSEDEGGQDDSTITWDIDGTGDRSLSYDYEDGRVTLDYDGNSFSLDLGGGGLGFGGSDDEDALVDEQPSETDDGYSYEGQDTGYDSGSGTDNGYGFDSGTGYDTSEDRDREVWGTPRDYDTPRSWGWGLGYHS